MTGVWTVSAYQRDSGRLAKPVTVTGTGDSEADALQALHDALTGVPKPDGTRMEELRRRIRHAYVDGAEQSSQERLGRPLTPSELARVIKRFGGS